MHRYERRNYEDMKISREAQRRTIVGDNHSSILFEEKSVSEVVRIGSKFIFHLI